MTAIPRRIFIGDVHGHYDGLMRLLSLIDPIASDQVYFVGDLIDRGPKSAQVVEFVRQSPYQCVLGNHEQLLLDAFQNGEVDMSRLQAWLYSGGQATLASYSNMDALFDHLDWLRSLPLYIDLDDVWLVHAGINPHLSLSEQTPQELCWIRETFHYNPRPYFKNKLIITGHTITFTFPGIPPGQITQGAGWLDIDTGAYHPKSGWLTGVDIDNQIVHQFNVFHNELRVRTFAEAITSVKPDKAKKVHLRLP